MDSVRKLVGLQPEPKEPPTFYEQLTQTFQLSYKTRIVAFVVLLILGLLCCAFVRLFFTHFPIFKVLN